MAEKRTKIEIPNLQSLQTLHLRDHWGTKLSETVNITAFLITVLMVFVDIAIDKYNLP